MASASVNRSGSTAYAEPFNYTQVAVSSGFLATNAYGAPPWGARVGELTNAGKC